MRTRDRLRQRRQAEQQMCEARMALRTVIQNDLEALALRRGWRVMGGSKFQYVRDRNWQPLSHYQQQQDVELQTLILEYLTLVNLPGMHLIWVKNRGGWVLE